MNTLTVVGLILFGWVLGAFGNVLTRLLEGARETAVGSIVDKLMAKGDATTLYNLRIADAVSQDPRTVAAAVDKELSRTALHVDEAPVEHYPWTTHPDYAGCDVTLDYTRGVAIILDTNAKDGSDLWEEDLNQFLSKFDDNSIWWPGSK